MAKATSYNIWAHRDAHSIFGPAANPVIRNGLLLSFKNRNGAHSECDRLNANSGNPHVRYSVKRAAAARRVSSPRNAPTRARRGSSASASRKASLSSLVRIGTVRRVALLALLARAEERGLACAGSAFIALSSSERDELLTHLENVRVSRSPIPRLRLPSA